MKIFKLMGVIAVIGIGLWASTVYAQVPFSRIVDLDCVEGNLTLIGCGAGGAHGQLVINFAQHGNATSGAVNFFGDFADGQPHPYVELDVYFPCQGENRFGAPGPRRFYVLYITLNPPGDMIRVISFNTDCYAWTRHTVVRLPAAINPTLWFTENLLVQVVLEADDGMDLSLSDVLEGLD